MKVIAIRNKYLEEHKTFPCLSNSEVDAMTIFKASSSWAGKFASSQGCKLRALHGEAGGVDVNAVEPDIAILRENINKYDHNNVYNMDKTGLFFKVLPNRSYVKEKDFKMHAVPSS